MRVLIIGYGVVGSNMHQLFRDADVYDPLKDLVPEGMIETTTFSDARRSYRTTSEVIQYDVGFVCVPTDKLPDGSADTSIVDTAIEQWHEQCRVIVIKSTVPVGYTERKISEGFSVVMSPEYFGATTHANAVNGDFVILGGKREATDLVAELYKEYTSADMQIFKTSATTAELVKYSENAWIATKVSFVNEMSDVCEAFGVDPDEWRELWLLDRRISRSHTYSYRGHPYWDSHCLNKDVPALLARLESAGMNAPLLEAMYRINEDRKR